MVLIMSGHNTYFAYALLLFSSALFGIYHPVQKQGLDSGYNPVEFAFASMFFCALFLIPFAFRDIVKHNIRFQKKDVCEFLLLGFLATALGLLLKLYGLSLTSANNVALITATSGVFLSILAYLVLKESLPKYFFLILLFMSFGLFLFKTGSFELNSFGMGDFLTMSYVIVLALATTLAKKYMLVFPSTIISSMRIIFGLPFLFVFYILFFEFNPLIFFSFWAVLAGFIFAVRVLSYYHAISLINLSDVAVFVIIAPIVTFAYSFFFFGESLNVVQIVGVIIVFVGIYVHLRMKAKLREKKSFAI